MYDTYVRMTKKQGYQTKYLQSICFSNYGYETTEVLSFLL